MTRTISLDARRLALALNLGSLTHTPACHTYACACVCERCTDRTTRYQALTATTTTTTPISTGVAAAIAKADSTEHYRRHAHHTHAIAA